jgi:hypothetical protein
VELPGVAGFDPAETVIQCRSRAHAHPGASTIHVQMAADRRTGKLLGAQMVGREGAAHRINAPAVALHAGMTVANFSHCDLAYAPPFGPGLGPPADGGQPAVQKNSALTALRMRPPPSNKPPLRKFHS